MITSIVDFQFKFLYTDGMDTLFNWPGKAVDNSQKQIMIWIIKHGQMTGNTLSIDKYVITS